MINTSTQSGVAITARTQGVFWRFLAVVATLQLFVCVDERIEALCRGVPVKRFPGPVVELQVNAVK